MTSHVLVINSGSSSIKYRLLDMSTGTKIAGGLVERIGEAKGRLEHTRGTDRFDSTLVVGDHEEGMRHIIAAFAEHGPALDRVRLSAVGHRVVHGGAEFSAPTIITDEVCNGIDRLSALAPLHNPANLAGIHTARRLFNDVTHVAVFDTAFHATMAEEAYTYAIPRSWRDDHGVRRYGFHGTSHAYVSRKAAELLGAEPTDVNLIVLHLGNGASACAVRGGTSVDTSMGLTPLEGLVMGTRSGDLDPAIMMHMHRSAGLSAPELDDALNHDSGLRGLADDNDMRQLRRRAEEGDEQAKLARAVYCHRIRKYVGAYMAVLGHVDAIVFTAGVGENDAGIRADALAGMRDLGIDVDPERNASGRTWISSSTSERAVLVIPTDEELEIARQSLAAAQSR